MAEYASLKTTEFAIRVVRVIGDFPYCIEIKRAGDGRYEKLDAYGDLNLALVAAGKFFIEYSERLFN